MLSKFRLYQKNIAQIWNSEFLESINIGTQICGLFKSRNIFASQSKYNEIKILLCTQYYCNGVGQNSI